MSLPAKVLDKQNNRNVGKSNSHPFLSALSQFQNFLGQKMTRLACVPQRLFSTLAGLNHENKAGRFCLPATNETSRADACDTDQALVHSQPVRRPTVKRDSTNSSAGSQKATPSFDPQLSALLDLLIQHEESLRAELVKTKQLRQQLENLIPNQPLKDFINSLD